MAPLLDQIRSHLGCNPDEVSVDAGYCSDANLRTVESRRIEGYIATGRDRSTTPGRPPRQSLPSRGSPIARMSTNLKRAGHRSRYRLRKQIVEPVFGQIKRQEGSGSSCSAASTKCLPSCPQYCRATPTEWTPFLGKPVSSMIHASIGPRRSICGRTSSRTCASTASSGPPSGTDKMQQRLVLRRCPIRYRHRRQRLHALALARQQKSRTVIPQRLAPIGMPDHAFQPRYI